jgi:hypothetical protein
MNLNMLIGVLNNLLVIFNRRYLYIIMYSLRALFSLNNSVFLRYKLILIKSK